MDDQRIVSLFFERDEAAIAAGQEKYGHRLQTLAYGIVQDLQTAQECENDTWLAAWNTIPPHDPGNYLYAFLARITRHLALNFCRDRSRLKRSAFVCELSTELEQCLPAPDDLECRLNEQDLRQAINGFLGSLIPEQRNVFLRRYWYMDSISDIAKRYRMTQSKVKTLLHRLRNRLRNYLEQEGYIL